MSPPQLGASQRGWGASAGRWGGPGSLLGILGQQNIWATMLIIGSLHVNEKSPPQNGEEKEWALLDAYTRKLGQPLAQKAVCNHRYPSHSPYPCKCGRMSAADPESVKATVSASTPRAATPCTSAKTSLMCSRNIFSVLGQMRMKSSSLKK